MGVHTPILPRHQRAAIEGEIEMHLQRIDLLIARLDLADAPFEDMEEDDHAGDPLDLHGEAGSDDGRGLLPIRPTWALDQSEGPVNHAQANRAYIAAAAGLVRSPTGGWRSSAEKYL